MKMTHKLCGAALLAAVGIVAALPSATKADNGTATQYNGKGVIQFTAPSDDGGGASWGTDSLTVEPNEDSGPLMILGASPLDFDMHEILQPGAGAGANGKRNYESLVYQQEGLADMPNFVQYKDMRVDSEDHSHELQAKITSNFTNGTSTLQGSEITFKNVNVYNASTKAVDTEFGPVGVQSSFKLEGDATDATSVVKNTDPTKGMGQWHVSFGDITDTADTWKDSVVLSINPNQVITEGEYKATILWEILDTPTP